MLNAITDAGVEAEDRLFVTLDPRTRQRQLSGGETVLFTDTVASSRICRTTSWTPSCPR